MGECLSLHQPGLGVTDALFWGFRAWGGGRSWLPLVGWKGLSLGGVTGLPRGGLRVPSPEARMKAFVLLCVQRDDSPRGCSCGGECCQGRGHCRATPPPQAPPTPTACNADGDGDEPQAGRFPSGCFLKYVATRGMSLSHTSGAPTSRNHWPFLGRQERTPLGRLPAKRQRPGK